MLALHDHTLVNTACTYQSILLDSTLLVPGVFQKHLMCVAMCNVECPAAQTHLLHQYASRFQLYQLSFECPLFSPAGKLLDNHTAHMPATCQSFTVMSCRM